jgi:ribosome-binding factor A
MLEQRARKYHQDRIAETIREEVDAMILGDLSDPRISSAHVTQVLLNPGGKSAVVYVHVDGGLEAEGPTVEGLMAARGWIRAELKERMGKRHVPELQFHPDRSERMAGRIDELLTRTRKRNKYAPEREAQAAGTPEAAQAPVGQSGSASEAETR